MQVFFNRRISYTLTARTVSRHLLQPQSTDVEQHKLPRAFGTLCMVGRARLEAMACANTHTHIERERGGEGGGREGPTSRIPWIRRLQRDGHGAIINTFSVVREIVMASGSVDVKQAGRAVSIL